MGDRIGYARVSTDDQNLDLQMDALQQARVNQAQIYADRVSGKSRDRQELNNCLKALRGGDTLVIWRLDRLGRSVADLVAITSDLELRGIGLESLTEKIDTSCAAGKLVFHVFAAMAEFERNLIRERTMAGLISARARGRSGGRKPALNQKQIAEVKKLAADQIIPIDRIASMYGVSRTTLYKYLKA